MPNSEQKITKLDSAKYSAVQDLSLSHWKLLLHSICQECQLFFLPDGVYILTVVLHGV